MQLARDYGFSDLVDRITSELQKIEFDDLDLKRQSYELSIPVEAVESYISEFTTAKSWQDALRLLTMNPPSGDVTADME